VRDLGLDSLQAVEVISEIESALNVSIPSDALPEIDTLSDLAKLVVASKARKASS
jgi:acyl carrier protein